MPDYKSDLLQLRIAIALCIAYARHLAICADRGFSPVSKERFAEDWLGR